MSVASSSSSSTSTPHHMKVKEQREETPEHPQCLPASSRPATSGRRVISSESSIASEDSEEMDISSARASTSLKLSNARQSLQHREISSDPIAHLPDWLLKRSCKACKAAHRTCSPHKICKACERAGRACIREPTLYDLKYTCRACRDGRKAGCGIVNPCPSCNAAGIQCVRPDVVISVPCGQPSRLSRVERLERKRAARQAQKIMPGERLKDDASDRPRRSSSVSLPDASIQQQSNARHGVALPPPQRVSRSDGSAHTAIPVPSRPSSSRSEGTSHRQEALVMRDKPAQPSRKVILSASSSDLEVPVVSASTAATGSRAHETHTANSHGKRRISKGKERAPQLLSLDSSADEVDELLQERPVRKHRRVLPLEQAFPSLLTTWTALLTEAGVPDVAALKSKVQPEMVNDYVDFLAETYPQYIKSATDRFSLKYGLRKTLSE